MKRMILFFTAICLCFGYFSSVDAQQRRRRQPPQQKVSKPQPSNEQPAAPQPQQKGNQSQTDAGSIAKPASSDPISGEWDATVYSIWDNKSLTTFSLKLRTEGEKVIGEVTGELVKPKGTRPEEVNRLLKESGTREELVTPVNALSISKGSWAGCILSLTVNVSNHTYILTATLKEGKLIGDYEITGPEVGAMGGEARLEAERKGVSQIPLGPCENKFKDPTADEVPTIEAALIKQITEEGPGNRFVIREIQPSDRSGSFTISAPSFTMALIAPSLLQVTMEFPGDSTPVSIGSTGGGVSIPFGEGSVHRFVGWVQLKDYIFIGTGDKLNRLTFAVIKNVGYVYLRGKGYVSSVKDKKGARLGYLSDMGRENERRR